MFAKSYVNKILLFITTVTVTSTAMAFTQPAGPKISLGAEYGYYHYREPGLMKDRGPMGGINTSFNYIFASQFFTGIEGRFLWGKTKYSSHGTGKMKNTPNFIFETRWLLGRHFSIAPQTCLSPFVGFGYRYKSDHSGDQKTSTGHHGYDRYSQYIYIPMGLRVTQTLNSDWKVAIQGEFDLFLRGRQESKIHGTLVHHQKHGYGLKGNIDLVRRVSQRSSLSVGPYVHFWDIKKSNIDRGTIEPHNKTVETGLAVKFNF